MNAIKSTVLDKFATNPVVKEVIDITTYSGDRMERLKNVALNENQNHKLRHILKHFLAPSIKPIFVDDEATTFQENDLVPDDWLAMVDQDLKMPFRMFDVETKNMVPTYNLGLHDQYCIVSHSWKGSEIGYGYFANARTFSPKKDSEADDEGQEERPNPNDLSNVIEKCRSDIKQLEESLQAALPNVTPREGKEGGQRPSDIAMLLQWFIDANGAEYALGRSQKSLHDATGNFSSAQREAIYYNDLWDKLDQADGFGAHAPKYNARNGNEAPKTESQPQKKNENKGEKTDVHRAIDRLTEEASRQKKDAEEKFQAASTARENASKTIKFFDDNRELCYGIEKLLVCLQHIRSSRKIDYSITQAKELFNKHFPKGGKRYVWLDTCCINKADSYELTESLALMGDWYANADFCLVHLDTPRSESSWIEEWKHWKTESHEPIEVNMETFDTIGHGANATEKSKNQVEWATRGWTLQELVLSKVTYYVNSHWKNLVRPIEHIGPFYHLRPFIQRYRRQPFVQKFKNITTKQMATLEELLEGEVVRKEMPREQKLSLMLQLLDFSPPKHLKEKMAEAQIGKAVLTASTKLPTLLKDLADNKGNVDTSCLSNLMDQEGHVNERIAVFNHMLTDLVDLTDEAIIRDRTAISKFSQVENMTNWITGDGLLDSSASTSLVTASSRQTTVPTDQAYSLMGILGVRFPAFPAEGLPKALARLLDEVVISYNDVSVFNWTGKHHGSTLHGRSLYPAAIDAFVDPVKNEKLRSKAETNQQILKLFKDQRVRRSEIATNVNSILAEILRTVKEMPDGHPLFTDLDFLGGKIKLADFDMLEPCVENLKKVVASLQKELANIRASEGEKKNTEKSADQAPDNKGKTASEKPGRFGFGRINSLPKSVKSFEVSKLPFGRKASSVQTNEAESPSEVSKPGEDATQDLDSPCLKYNHDEEPLDKYIQHVLDVLDHHTLPQGNPSQASELSTDTLNSDSKDTTSRMEESQSPDKRMVCPNPVTVSTAGIRGIFDIQRIIVDMVEPETLRSRIRHAVSGQFVDGWCTVSTGFSMTLVAFSCERDMLEQQLDLVEVIKRNFEEKKKSNDPDDENSENKNTAASNEGAQKDAGQNLPQGAPNAANSEANSQTPPKTNSFLSQVYPEKSHEQKKVSRMISFVQKPDLHSIAGEWVLARFTGVPRARWYLCRLELGAGNDFYGRRIPTDAFSFEDAAPEQGLTEYWHQFTREKKERTCDTLEIALYGKKQMTSASDEIQKLVHSWKSDVHKADHTPFELAMEVTQNASWDKVVNLGKAAGSVVTGFSSEAWAEYLDSRIEKGALKRVPVSLRTPVKDLSHNRKLLPSMFHAGREVHMF
ncbi:hypothetical protein N7508_003039 [Penicillium antarcticum]|uniref:uncharacterized protein n=1 Tax=Penicillium antarcticum TaxID=416450 RepID=UPI002392B08C|nr:uncharacterized protein N7508_003039 [Penicillium antarcticum]KAJ5312209.1 hypothetical protein N7508_003039 [Penicillium antarcticum]